MILKNNSTKIIGIKDTSFLPGETGVCPDGYENNPVVQKYIKDGTFTVVGEVKGVNHDAEESEPAGITESPDSVESVESAFVEKKAKKASGTQKSE